MEFALILPVLLLLILGLLQFAFILTSQILMTSAAREGVRLAAVGGEDTAIKNRILEITSPLPFLDVSGEEIEIEPEAAFRFEDVEVRIYFPGEVGIVVPLLGSIFENGSITLTTEASMRYEIPVSYTAAGEVVIDKFEIAGVSGNNPHNIFKLTIALSNNDGNPVSEAFTVKIRKIYDKSGNAVPEDSQVVEEISDMTAIDDGTYTREWRDKSGDGWSHGDGTYIAELYLNEGLYFSNELQWKGKKN